MVNAATAVYREYLFQAVQTGGSETVKPLKQIMAEMETRKKQQKEKKEERKCYPIKF